MSDAMSNREIEDVLSSIRRLVARETASAAPDRLVLTEAQRIAVNDSNAPDSAAGGGSGDGASEDARARLQAAIGGLAVAGEGDGKGSSGDDSAIAEPAEPAEPQADATAGVKIAPEPVEIAATSAADAGDHEEAGEAAPADAAPTAGTDYGEAEEWHGPAWQRDAGMPVTAAPEDGHAEATAAEAADEYADDDGDAPGDTLIDEEMLRSLVAQLVREELRGQLGERITMQVRKLVRAEIARALDERQYL